MTTPATNAGKRARIAELDGLRAFAVLAVVALHLTHFARVWILSPLADEIVQAIGGSGVHVFFVISGYIITSLLIHEHAENGRVSLTAFYARRFFRIVPPFAAYVATLFLLGALGLIVVSPRSLAVALLFLGDTTLLGPSNWFVEHTWTLAIEEQFYVVFPLLFCVLLGCRREASRKAVVAFYVLCLVSPGIMHVLVGRLGPGFVNFSILYQFRFILAGILLALLGRPLLSEFRRRNVLNRLVPFALGAFFVFGSITPFGKLAFGLPFGAIEPIACALFVLWFVENPTHSGPLRNPIVQALGRCSYSVYLWQQLFTGPVGDYRSAAMLPSVFSPLAIVAVAAASYVLVERPCIRLGHRTSARLTQRAAPNSV